jgi:hypothetical protein
MKEISARIKIHVSRPCHATEKRPQRALTDPVRLAWNSESMVKRRRQRRRLHRRPDRLCVQAPHTQLPLKDEALALGVAGDPLTVAAELWRWWSS